MNPKGPEQPQGDKGKVLVGRVTVIQDCHKQKVIQQFQKRVDFGVSSQFYLKETMTMRRTLQQYLTMFKDPTGSRSKFTRAVEAKRKEKASEGKNEGETRNRGGGEHQLTERDRDVVSHSVEQGKGQTCLFQGGEYWEVEETTM